MIDLDTRRAAALLLRWSAQLAANENPQIVSACRIGLRDLGYDLDALAPLARALAAQLLAYCGQVATRDERKAA